MKLIFQKLRPEAIIPSRATRESAGFDLSVCMDEPVTIAPGETRLMHIGVAVVLPVGTAGMVYPRSGLATKHGIALANCVGVIDSDYRGEVMVPLYNHSSEPFTVQPGDRVAQMVVTPVLQPEAEELPMGEPLPASERGAGGFGSTGIEG
jgi:dUTP pyrophosphatase